MRKHTTVLLIWSTILITVSGFFFFFGPNRIPLWYSHALAKNQLAPKVFFLLFPIASVSIIGLTRVFLRHANSLTAQEKELVMFSSYLPLFLLFLASIHILFVTL